MSLRSAIPWRFALQHCPPPLHRPVFIFRPPEVICQLFPSGKYQNWTRRFGQGKISTSGVGQIRVSKWARPEYQTQLRLRSRKARFLLSDGVAQGDPKGRSRAAARARGIHGPNENRRANIVTRVTAFWARLPALSISASGR